MTFKMRAWGRGPSKADMLFAQDSELIGNAFLFFLPQAGEMEVHNPLFQDDPTPKGK